MKKVFYIIFLLITFLNADAQGFNKRFTLGYPGIFGENLTEKDGKIFTVAFAADTVNNNKNIGVFACFNRDGDIVFSNKVDLVGSKKVQPENNLIKTIDNGFAVSGLVYFSHSVGFEAMLLKFDSIGNLLFYNSYPSGDSNNLFFVSKSLIEVDGGGYLMIGSVQYPNFKTDLFVIRTDRIGNELWRKLYSSPYFSLQGISIFKSEKGYIVSGLDNNYVTTTSQKKVYPYMMEIDTAGNVLWKWWYLNDTKTGVTYQGIRTDDGGYILSGYKIIGQSQSGDLITIPHILKLDSNRGIQWQTNIGNFLNDNGYDKQINKTIIDKSGNLVVAGSTRNIRQNYFTETYGFIGKVSATGDSIWARSYSLSNDTFPVAIGYNSFNDVITDVDGGYILIGETTEMFQGGAGQQLWLVRVDSNGCVQENYCSGSKPVGIAPLSFGEGLGVRCYPNPATSTVTIEFDDKVADAYLIYDLAGRVVLSGAIANNSQVVDVSGISKGVYLLKVLAKGKAIANGKILKE